MALGLSGLLPPVALLAAMLWSRLGSGVAEVAALAALAYGALILSFLGGIWWGAAAARLTDHEMGPVLAVAVLPSLWAFAAFALGAVSPLWTGLVLAAGLLLALVEDARLVGQAALPGWWMRLRVPLSLGLAACMLAVGWLGR